ncbi:MAG TPA: L-threonylcarbamoyladenylate synthase [Bacteroidia bacterium]|jgi:tRNA threonylcarbamoyl adenosine modification protein (Sua5/YciO/YrdC/YwlC family)|nr:L-threonylcarbamoyladenylate synthase [Bacteroidia bacterium]
MLVNINSQNPDARKIAQAVDVLSKGGVIIIPTDTIYALACDLYHYKAFEKICRMKDVRPDKANFSLLCNDLSNISHFTRPFDRSIYKLLNRALPGPYTFILDASSEVPSVFRSRKKTIGLRIPNNKIVLDLIEKLGHPLVVTSIHDIDEIKGYPTDPEEIDEIYGNQVEMVIDGGAGKIKASTVIDCTGDSPVITREGAGDPDILN